MKYTFNTNVLNNGVIEQFLIDDQAQGLCKWAIDTEENSIKEALIKLGWTPPNWTKYDIKRKSISI